MDIVTMVEQKKNFNFLNYILFFYNYYNLSVFIFLKLNLYIYQIGMDSFINVIITFVLLTVIYKYFENRSYDVVMHKSNIDNKDYLVRNLPDKQKAADTLASISKRLSKLVKYIEKNLDKKEEMYQKYVKDQYEIKIKGNIDKENEHFKKLVFDKKKKLKTDLQRLVNNFNPNKISETTPDAKYTSYSVNKGEKIVMCIRNKKTANQDIININTLMFVALHETAHLMTKSVGHHPEFWDNFRILINIAVDPNVNIYKEVNFDLYPEPYCGMTINSVPN